MISVGMEIVGCVLQLLPDLSSHDVLSELSPLGQIFFNPKSVVFVG